MPLHLTPVLSYRWWANQSEKPCDVRGELITPTRSWEPSPYIYIYIYIYAWPLYICTPRVFEFMYDVGANNIKVGRDRKMAWAREVVLAWKAAVNRQPHTRIGNFSSRLCYPNFPPLLLGEP